MLCMRKGLSLESILLSICIVGGGGDGDGGCTAISTGSGGGGGGDCRAISSGGGGGNGDGGDCCRIVVDNDGNDRVV